MIFKDIYVFVQLGGKYVPAGILQQNTIGRGYSFRYGNKYIQRPDAIALDPITLPLGTEEFESPELFTVFRDAAPDRWGRKVLSIMAQKHYGEMSELEILTALHSEHRMGALAFGASPDKPCSMAAWAQNEQSNFSFMPMDKLQDVLAIVREVNAIHDEGLVTALQKSLPEDAFFRALAAHVLKLLYRIKIVYGLLNSLNTATLGMSHALNTPLCYWHSVAALAYQKWNYTHFLKVMYSF